MPARAVERRVLAERVGHRRVLGQPELLALVDVGTARQREHQRGGGAGPAQAEHGIRLGVVGPDAVGPRPRLVEPEPGRVPHDVVVREHPRRRGADAVVGAQRGLDDRAQGHGVPVGVEEVEVERLVHLVGAHVARQAVGRRDPRLGAQDAVGLAVGVEHRAPAPVDLVHAVLVPHRGRAGGGVVEHVAVGRAQLLGVAPLAGGAGVGVDLVVEAHLAVPVGQALALDQAVGDVDPEAVDAPVAPEPQDVVELGDDLGVLPVQVGLGDVEDVQVPLAGGAVGLGDAGPAAAAEDRGPVVRRLLAVRGRGRRGRCSARARGCPARRPARPGTTRARCSCGWARGRRSPSGRARGPWRPSRRRRRASRTAGRCRGSRRRRSRRRSSARRRTGSATRHPRRGRAGRAAAR